MGIAENIRYLRLSHGLTQEEFGLIAGVSDAAVSTWEAGTKEPRMGAVTKIAHHFGLALNDLIENNTCDNSSPTRGIKIPVLGNVAVGIPIEAVEEILDYEEITPQLAATGEFFALKIRGSSMEPRMMDGDVVVVRRQSDVDSGDVAVVLVNGDEATVKKVRKQDTGLSLIPNNPSYDVMFFTPQEVESLPVRIIGKVVELRAKM